MKKSFSALCLLISQIIMAQDNAQLAAYAEDMAYTSENRLTFMRLKESQRISEAEAAQFINTQVLNDGANKVSVLRTEKDELGFTHIRYNVLQNGNILANRIIVAHFRNGRLVSLNGDLYEVPVAANGYLLSEKSALNAALAKVNAKKYKWDNREEELMMRRALNDPSFTYKPAAEKVVFEKDGRFYNAYQFNIYAEEPLYRANVFVNAATGEVLEEQNLICTADVPASANTKYSGTQTITADFTGSLYRLRETGRGLGVETYNMKNTSTYAMTTAADFTNTTANWTTTGVDQAAADAHWGAEKTYDYYLSQHNRNSINNAGFKLLSFVHYQTNFTNAFWDGQRMTYGDGNGTSFKIFTALDVCGHEITHGLTSNTGNLTYSNESGALNESFSDIFGVAIENYARPTNWNWRVGEDITTNGFRNMANPNAFGDPDTYGGTNYYTGTADNGGVHTNSGVSNFWFYLLSAGGSGTNDINNPYSVTGIGISNAAKIAFRALTVYFTPSTNFLNARQLTIQAAKDLFGSCSNEVIQTTRAWYAVGVGANYVAGQVGPNFTSVSNFCSTPAVVNFSNTTANGLSYTWDFGDGSPLGTGTNISHTYTNVGTYSVKLVALGCSNAKDSITKTAYIVVNPPVSSPVVSNTLGCENMPVILTGSGSATLKWYDSPSGGLEIGSGNQFATPGLTGTTTYYAANTITLTPVSGGIPSSVGGGYLNSNANWLVFDVYQSGVLNSVVVYAQTVGNRVIQLRSSANAVLQTATVNLGLGMNVVPLNFYLTPGVNYRLGLSNTSASSLYRTTTGVSYPYSIGGAVSIKTSNSGNTAYYYFYNWQVTIDGCASPRVPVVVTINPQPLVTMNAPAGPVCLSDVIDLQGAPSGGSYLGTAMSGPLFTADQGIGTYTVSYTYTDANSCSNTADATLIVEECTGISNQAISNTFVSVYPNPVKDDLMIRGGTSDLSFSISDASGRIVLQKELSQAEETVKLGALSRGMYIISVKDSKGATVKTMKLVKD